MDIRNFTIKRFRDGLMNKDFSAVEAVKEFYGLIEVEDKEIGAYLSLTKDLAFEQAGEVDVKLARGEEAGLLAGAPLAVKDNILIEGLKTTAASKILEQYEAAYDATVIRKLKKAQAVFLGKTNLDEFAMGSSTENSGYQLTKNPYDLSRVPGGSSGGSAAAVATGLALAALGSDTGGSIRQPAGFCGVIGFKPTYGAVSRYGLIAMASSLDQIGPITKTVEDAQILFSAIRGKDERDATSVNESMEHSQRFAAKDLTIGLPKEYFIEGLDKKVGEEIQKAVKIFEKMGVKIKEISLPHTKYALSCYYIIMPAEVSSNLARFDGIRYSRIENNALNLKDIYFANKGAGFGAEAKRRIILGTFVLSSGYYDAYYAKAQKVRNLIKQDFDRAFDPSAGGVDAILTPVSPTAAFKIGEKTADPLQMYLSDIFTIPQNLAGLPAVSIPARQYSRAKGELPVGFQLIAKQHKDDFLLELARQYEQFEVE